MDDTYYDGWVDGNDPAYDTPAAGGGTSWDGFGSLLNGGLDLASKVANIATAFRAGTDSPDAQRARAAVVQQQQQQQSKKTFWIIGAVVAVALAIVAFFVLRKR